MGRILKIFAVTLMLVILSGYVQAAENENAATPKIPQNDPQHSPFAYILQYMQTYPGEPGQYPEFHFNDGYFNFTEDYWLNPSSGSIEKWAYAIPSANKSVEENNASPDITWQLLRAINNIPGAGKHTYIVTYAVDEDKKINGQKEDIFKLFPNIPAANIHVSHEKYVTHGKNMLATNGETWFSQNGSANLQTVAVTCKANNSLVFVEKSPDLYNHFIGLWKAVRDNGTSAEYFSDGTKDSSGLAATAPIQVGERKVSFYAGRNNCFVGPTWPDSIGGLSVKFPYNLYPPIKGEIENLNNVNWYDQIIFDAGMLLYEGKNEVTIDVVMFEIGAENPFIDNLYRFVKYGFENGNSISKADSSSKPHKGHSFPGRLTVNLYYQFQNAAEGSATYKYLNTADGNINGKRYTMNVTKIWQNFQGDAPKTPQDMHHKFAIITCQEENGSSRDYKLYVATSNLDQPKVGSGRKWQSGTVIEAVAAEDPLFTFYKTELQYVLKGQFGAASLNAKNGNAYFDSGVAPGQEINTAGIAAFAYPLLVPAN